MKLHEWSPKFRSVLQGFRKENKIQTGQKISDMSYSSMQPEVVQIIVS